MNGTIEIRLARGDVARLGIVQEGSRIRLLVYQGSDSAPLIQAVLSDDERDALVVALRSGDDRPSGRL